MAELKVRVEELVALLNAVADRRFRVRSPLFDVDIMEIDYETLEVTRFDAPDSMQRLRSWASACGATDVVPSIHDLRDALLASGSLEPANMDHVVSRVGELLKPLTVERPRLGVLFVDTNVLCANLLTHVAERLGNRLPLVVVSGGVLAELERLGESYLVGRELSKLRSMLYRNPYSTGLLSLVLHHRAKSMKARRALAAMRSLYLLRRLYRVETTELRERGDRAIVSDYAELCADSGVEGLLVTFDKDMQQKAFLRGLSCVVVEMPKQLAPTIKPWLLGELLYYLALAFWVIRVEGGFTRWFDIISDWPGKTPKEWIEGWLTVRMPECVAEEFTRVVERARRIERVLREFKPSA